MRLETYLLTEAKKKTFYDTLEGTNKEYVEKYYTEDGIAAFDKWWKAVNKSCKPYLTEYKKAGKPLWRGMKSLSVMDELGVREVRKDRRPLDTHPFVQEMMDEWFEDQFGWKPRSEGVFTTSRSSQASAFGSFKAVFPVGKFSLVYSKRVEDIYNKYFSYSKIKDGVVAKIGIEELRKEFANTYQFDEWFQKNFRDVAADKVDPKAKELVKEYVYNCMDMTEYHDDSLLDAVNAGTEVMLKCDKFYWCDPSNMKLVELLTFGVISG